MNLLYSRALKTPKICEQQRCLRYVAISLFTTIREVLRIARITKLDDGKVQLVLTDGNACDPVEVEGSIDESFKGKVIIDVICANRTDSDIIAYCNRVTDFVIAYDIRDQVVIQPSSAYDQSVSVEAYLSQHQENAISMEWNGHDIVVKTNVGHV